MDFVNTINFSGKPLHDLKLKEGAIVVLLRIRELEFKKGLCIGNALISQGLHANVLDAEVLTRMRQGLRVFIPRIDIIE